jgi:hypothetical protein
MTAEMKWQVGILTVAGVVAFIGLVREMRRFWNE